MTAVFTTNNPFRLPSPASLNKVADAAVYGSTAAVLMTAISSHVVIPLVTAVSPLTGAIANGASRLMQNMFRVHNWATQLLSALIGSGVATAVACYAFPATVTMGPVVFFGTTCATTFMSHALNVIATARF